MAKVNKYAIGVDLGGTFIKAGVVSSSGKIVEKISIDSKADKGPKAVIKQIEKAISQLQDTTDVKIQGIGIGAPGVISIKKGTVENPPNLPGWGRVHLGKIVSDATGIPTFVENDANAAAVGEKIFGAGKDYDSFIMVTLGTGVGGGIILNRKLYRGDTGAAGELGHIVIDHNGPLCGCGATGCIEAYAGNKYIIQETTTMLEKEKNSMLWELTAGDLATLTPKLISEAAGKGDDFAIRVVKLLGFRLGVAFSTVANLLDVTIFIVGGGVAGFGDLLFNQIHETTKARVLTSLKPRVHILPAKLKNEAGIQGASALVFMEK